MVIIVSIYVKIFMQEINITNSLVYIKWKREEIYKIWRDWKIYRVQYKTGGAIYPFKLIDIEIIYSFYSDSSNEILSYFKEVNLLLWNAWEERQIRSLVQKQLEKLDFVHPDSFLASYLSKTNKNRCSFLNDYIFPFSFNISQKKALEAIYKSDISLISWPPWTWKTQTILNVISNLVVESKTVAVVSNNNNAVLNVKEKMGDAWYGYFLAMLWSVENKRKFFENIPELQRFDEEDINNFEAKEKLNSILKLMSLSNELAKLKEEYSSYILEQEYFDRYSELNNFEEIKKLSFYNFSPDKLVKFLSEHSFATILKKDKKLFHKVKLFFKYWFKEFSKLWEDDTDLVLSIQKRYYSLSIKELENKINKIELELENKKFEDLLLEYKEYSEVIFKQKLNKKFWSLLKRDFTLQNYKGALFKDFIKRFPVILSSTYSIKGSVPEWFLFDYLIIDESSQVDVITASLSFACAKNVIIVWDNKQLPHIITKDSKKLEAPDNDYHISDNIIKSINKIYQDNIPNNLLREHYRCNPPIINFCNQKFYNNELIIHTNNYDKNIKSLSLIRTVPWNHMRKITGKDLEKWTFNERELEEIGNHIGWKNYQDLWLVYPYALQARKSKEMFDLYWFESDTVHKFQWREKDSIIMSTVLSDNRNWNIWLSFVDNPNLLNVAVSRAKNDFTLVTDNSFLAERWRHIKDLVNYIEYQILDNEVMDWKVVSVFDLLYTKFSEELRSLKNRVKWNSKFASENIIETVLRDDLLKIEKYSDFKYSGEYKLKLLVNESDLFSEEELKFMRTKSAVDFVVFSKYNKLPVLAIEVDGFGSHENNYNQQQRDAKKASILEKVWIPLLRLPTTKSGEREKLVEEFNKIVKSKISSELEKIL